MNTTPVTFSWHWPLVKWPPISKLFKFMCHSTCLFPIFLSAPFSWCWPVVTSLPIVIDTLMTCPTQNSGSFLSPSTTFHVSEQWSSYYYPPIIVWQCVSHPLVHLYRVFISMTGGQVVHILIISWQYLLIPLYSGRWFFQLGFRSDLQVSSTFHSVSQICKSKNVFSMILKIKIFSIRIIAYIKTRKWNSEHRTIWVSQRLVMHKCDFRRMSQADSDLVV